MRPTTKRLLTSCEYRICVRIQRWRQGRISLRERAAHLQGSYGVSSLARQCWDAPSASSVSLDTTHACEKQLTAADGQVVDRAVDMAGKLTRACCSGHSFRCRKCAYRQPRCPSKPRALDLCRYESASLLLLAWLCLPRARAGIVMADRSILVHAGAALGLTPRGCACNLCSASWWFRCCDLHVVSGGSTSTPHK